MSRRPMFVSPGNLPPLFLLHSITCSYVDTLNRLAQAKQQLRSRDMQTSNIVVSELEAMTTIIAKDTWILRHPNGTCPKQSLPTQRQRDSHRTMCLPRAPPFSLSAVDVDSLPRQPVENRFIDIKRTVIPGLAARNQPIPER